MFFDGEKNSVSVAVWGVNVPLVAVVVEVPEFPVDEVVVVAGADVVVRSLDEVVVFACGDPLEHDAKSAAPAASAETGTTRRGDKKLGMSERKRTGECKTRIPRRYDRGGGRSAAAKRGSKTMADTVDSLILDLLEWIGPTPRPYDEVMEAWRTSCPRLPVWEEATQRGLVVRARDGSNGSVVAVSPVGVGLLQAHRHPSTV